MENAKFLRWNTSNVVKALLYDLEPRGEAPLRLSFKPKQAVIFQPASDHSEFDPNTCKALKGFTWTWHYPWCKKSRNIWWAVINRSICLQELHGSDVSNFRWGTQLPVTLECSQNPTKRNKHSRWCPVKVRILQNTLKLWREMNNMARCDHFGKLRPAPLLPVHMMKISRLLLHHLQRASDQIILHKVRVSRIAETVKVSSKGILHCTLQHSDLEKVSQHTKVFCSKGDLSVMVSQLFAVSRCRLSSSQISACSKGPRAHSADRRPRWGWFLAGQQSDRKGSTKMGESIRMNTDFTQNHGAKAGSDFFLLHGFGQQTNGSCPKAARWITPSCEWLQPPQAKLSFQQGSGRFITRHAFPRLEGNHCPGRAYYEVDKLRRASHTLNKWASVRQAMNSVPVSAHICAAFNSHGASHLQVFKCVDVHTMR